MIHFRPVYGYLSKLKKAAMLVGCTCPGFAPTPYLPHLCHCGYTAEMHPVFHLGARRGWVQQRGNNCGAASIASAINALAGLPSSDPTARTLEHAVQVYDDMFTAAIAEAEVTLRERLGGVFDSVLARLPHPNDVERKGERRVMRRAFAAEVQAVRDDWAAALADAGVPTTAGAAQGDDSAAPARPRRDSSVERSDDDDEKEAARAISGADHGPEGFLAPSTAGLSADEAEAIARIQIEFNGRMALLRRHEELFMRWWLKRWGRDRLRFRKSTAAVGNSAIMTAVATLGKQLGLRVKARMLFNRNLPRGGMAVSAADDEAALDKQWAFLIKHLTRPKTVLLFHLTNHYALVFAHREYVDPDTGSLERHILCARAGQEPKTWLSWTECRAPMLSWAGYGMIVIRAEDTEDGEASSGTEEP